MVGLPVMSNGQVKRSSPAISEASSPSAAILASVGAAKAWAGEDIPIWGDGTQTVDLIHVDDLGRMLVAAAEFSNGEVFDGGTGVPLSVHAVAQLVLDAAESRSRIVNLPMRDGEIPTNIAATGEGWDLLGWRPRIDFTQLADTVRWYRPAAGRG